MYEVSFFFVYYFRCFLLSGNAGDWLTLKLILQMSDGKDNTLISSSLIEDKLEVGTEGIQSSYAGILSFLLFFALFPLWECLWVINVEARVAHCRMAKTIIINPSLHRCCAYNMAWCCTGTYILLYACMSWTIIHQTHVPVNPWPTNKYTSPPNKYVSSCNHVVCLLPARATRGRIKNMKRK